MSVKRESTVNHSLRFTAAVSETVPWVPTTFHGMRHFRFRRSLYNGSSAKRNLNAFPILVLFLCITWFLAKQSHCRPRFHSRARFITYNCKLANCWFSIDAYVRLTVCRSNNKCNKLWKSLVLCFIAWLNSENWWMLIVDWMQNFNGPYERTLRITSINKLWMFLTFNREVLQNLGKVVNSLPEVL